MAKCVKTGAVLFVENYGCFVNVDVHIIQETGIMVLKMGGAFEDVRSFSQEARADLYVHIDEDRHYWDPRRGILVASPGGVFRDSNFSFKINGIPLMVKA